MRRAAVWTGVYVINLAALLLFGMVITSDGGGSTAAVAAVENDTAVTTITATDGDAGAQR